MGQFTINERTYRTCRMNAFAQLHVARRILPVMAKLPEMVGMTLDELIGNAEKLKTVFAGNLNAIHLDVIAKTLADLKDEDVEFILNACCDATEIKEPQGAGWSPIRKNGVLMYAHVGVEEMMGIAINVIKENLGGFFSESAPISPPEKVTPAQL